MKTILYVMLLLLFATSCGNNPKRKMAESTLSVADSVKVVMPKLHSTIVEGVLEMIKKKDNLIGLLEPGASPLSVSLDESFIAVEFIIDPKGNKVNFSDSTVNIALYSFPGHTAPIGTYYKGVIENVGGYNVGIFDVGGFGEKYYNTDSVKYIPLKNFKYYDLKIVPTICYYVENGELKYWNP